MAAGSAGRLSSGCVAGSGVGLGVVVALDDERRACGLGGDSRLRLEVAGMGGAAAAQATRRLLGAGVAGVVSLGYCGALSPRLAAGDVVLPQRVVDVAGIADGTVADGVASLSTDAALTARIAAALGAEGVSGALLTAAAIVHEPREKEALGREHGAAAVDMESAAVLRTAQAAGVAAAVLRVVVDPLHLRLPGFVGEGSGVFEVLRGWGRDRRSVLPTLRLALAHRAARASLRRVARRLEALPCAHW